MEARYLRARQSVDEYLRQTSLANLHLHLEYRAPDGAEINFEESVTELPAEPVEVSDLKPNGWSTPSSTAIRMASATSIGR